MTPDTQLERLDAAKQWVPAAIQPEHKALIREAADAIEALRGELDHFKSSGIVEVAIRNASVSEYMRHWEGRTERAEAERDALRRKLGRISGLCSQEGCDGEPYDTIQRILDAP